MLQYTHILKQKYKSRIHILVRTLVFGIALAIVACAPEPQSVADLTESTHKVPIIFTATPILNPRDVTLTEEGESPTLIPSLTPTVFPSATPTPTTPTVTQSPTEPPTAVPVSPTPLFGNISQYNLKAAFTTRTEQDNQKQDQIWVVYLSNGQLENVLTLPYEIGLFSSKLAWSNNGEYLAFTRFTEDGQLAIATLDIDTGSLHQIFTMPQYPANEAEFYTIPDVRPNSWSPNDEWLAITINYATENSFGEIQRTNLVNLVTDEVIELDNDRLNKLSLF